MAGRTETMRLNIAVDMNTTEAIGGINKIEKQLQRLSLPKGLENSFEKVVQKIRSDIAEIQNIENKGIKTKGDYNRYNKLTEGVNNEYSKLLNLINRLNSEKITLKADTGQIQQIENKIKQVQKDFRQAFNTSDAYKGSNGLKNFETTLGKLDTKSKTLAPNLRAMMDSLKGGDIRGAQASVQSLMTTMGRLSTVNKIKISEALGLTDLTGKLNEAKVAGGHLSSEINSMFKTQVSDRINQLIKQIGKDGALSAQEIERLSAELLQVKAGNLEKVDDIIRRLATDAKSASTSFGDMSAKAQDSAMYQYDKAMQVNDLRMQVQYFFGLQNMIHLFQKGVKDAIDTVKELDAAMTQTAVVTNFSVGDMWEQLPEYTKNANELSTTIADMYNATTLYYQQGLNTEQAMGTAVETLKMARIAGIEGAEATDLMTAALRGFRMESNEVNASHVNDVYSILAARTASDTYEIGTAVSKTASLASSANMDLESTATFLAQIIETTREAPETAGTALKTIIARFGELKKLVGEGMTSGTDEEGEIIDVNRVDTALKTAGISLSEFIKGNEGLDKVFLRLAERWDTLSVAQQRYIATQSAGARQQSRFIAMMQDYSRTQELLGLAYDSEGAGDKQFEKTKDSMEAKLNELKNAYNQFIMGIANSSAIKTVVTGITKAFTGVNKVIQLVNKGVGKLNKGLGGTVTAALSIGTAFGALKLGGKMLNAGVNGIGTMLLGRGTMVAGKAQGNAGIAGGFMNARAAAFTKPITSKLDILIAVTRANGKAAFGKGAVDNGITLKGRGFLEARRTLNGTLAKGTTAGDVSKIMSQYDKGTQMALMQSSPGTAKAIQGSFLKAAENSNMDKAGQVAAKNFIKAQGKAFKIGGIDYQQYERSARLAAKGYSESYQKNLLTYNSHPASQIFTKDTNDLAYNRTINQLVKKQFQNSSMYKSYLNGNPYGYTKDDLKTLYQGYANQVKGLGNQIPQQVSGVQRLSNAFGSAGAAISSVGMTLQSFSANLSAMGADKAAAAVNGLGSAFTSLGMAASSVGSIISLVANPIGAAVAGGIAAVTAAVVIYKQHIKGIREEGKKVTEDFKKNVTEQKQLVEELSAAYEEYIRLRNGVDAKGRNVSLGEDEYKRYQELTDKFIDMDGTLRQGINENGQAYISQYADIAKALGEETEEIEKAQEKYLSAASGQKIINQVGTYKRIKGIFNPMGANGVRQATVDPSLLSGVGYAYMPTSATTGGKFTTQARDIQHALTSLGSAAADLGLTDINWDNINAIDAKKLYDGADALQGYVDIAEGLTDEQKTNVTKSITDLQKTWDDAVEASKPTTDWLETYLTSVELDSTSIEETIADQFDVMDIVESEGKKADKRLATLGEEQAATLTGNFRAGLEELTLQGVFEGKSAQEMQDMAVNYSKSFEDLTNTATLNGSIYSDALIGIASAQAQFDKDIGDNTTTMEEATASYQDSIGDQIRSLNDLAESYEEAAARGDVSAGLIAESIRESMLGAVAYTSSSSEQIARNLNSLSQSFEKSHAALADYQEKTKDLNDYYTDAMGMETILEDIGWDKKSKKFTGQDAEGMGSQKFWLGAEKLVDKDALEKGAEDFDSLKKKIAKLAPTLEEGEKGFKNFLELLRDYEDNPKMQKFLKDLDGDGSFDRIKVDDSNLHEMADLLGVSDEYLSSMINKSRQFMKWDLSNPKELANTLKKTDEALKGGKYTYYSYDAFAAEGRAQGLTDTEIETTRGNVAKNGVRIINIDELKDKDNKNYKQQRAWAKDLVTSLNLNKAKSPEEYVKPFIESGQYTAEESLEILKAGLPELDITKEDFTKAWSDSLENTQELGELRQQTDYQATMVSLLDQMVAEGGTIPEEVKNSIDGIDQAVNGKEGENDTKYELFGEGKGATGEKLTYKEKKDTEKEINDLIDQADHAMSVAQIAIDNSAEGSEQRDKAQKEYDRAEDLKNQLQGYKNAGTVGMTTAEKVLGEHAEDFNYGAFHTDKQFESLRELDSLLKGVEDLDYSTLIDNVNAAFGEDSKSGKSILDQYAKQELANQGYTGKVDNTLLKTLRNNPQLLDNGLFEDIQTYQEDYQKFLKRIDLNNEEQKKWFKDPMSKDITVGNVNVGQRKGFEWNRRTLSTYKNFAEESNVKDGDISTVLGSWDDKYGKSKIPIAFTPMLSDDKGNLTPLSSQEVGTYLDTLVKTAESEVGTKDKDKLGAKIMELDKKGLESSVVEGRQLKNLIAGTGDEAESLSHTMHYLGQDGAIALNFKEMEESAGELGLTTEQIQKNFDITDEAAIGFDKYLNFVKDNFGEPLEQDVDYKPDTDELDKTNKKTEDTTLHQDVVQTATPPTNTTTSITFSANTESAAKKVNQLTTDAAKKSADIIVGADTSTGESSVTSFKNIIDATKGNIQVGVEKGTGFSTTLSSIVATIKSQVAKVKVNAWTGRNNHRMGAFSTGRNTIPLNSFASGKKRTTKGNTEMALTGELGPEMAWYPKEGRAELLGVGGPQFVPDLPKNSVIWNARQTKQILNRKSIPLNSHAEGDIPSKYKENPKKTTKGKTTKSEDSKTGKKTAENTGKTAKAIETLTKREVQIYNLTKQIEQRSNKIEKNSDKIQNKLDDAIDFSYSMIRKTVGNQSKLIKKSISDNKKLSKKYSANLKDLDKGRGKYRRYQVSYEKNTKDKKGETTTKSVDTNINLGKYITTKNGAYIVNTKAINKVTNKALAKSIFDAATKEVDDLTSKRDSANKAMEDAKQKLQDLRDELKDTLFAWENELTEIKNLENKISLGKSYTDSLKDVQELIANRANGSLNNLKGLIDEYGRSIEASISATKAQITNQRSLLEAYRRDLHGTLNLDSEYNNLDVAKKQLSAAKKSGNAGNILKAKALVNQRQDELDAAQVGARLTSVKQDEYGQIQVSFDWKQLEASRLAGNVSNTEYDAVKKYYEDVIEKAEKINEGVADTAASINSIYEQRNDQYQTVSDYTQKIREGMEEEEQKTIDKLSNLNDAIQDAFKELIDKVRKELEKQRQAEENRETEKDISNQMNRLAMLRADTSGGNAAEIAQLEKDISDATRDYEDSLEDQLLDRLEDQADEAAKQREKQIKLLTAQLNYNKANGEYLAKAEALVQKIVDGTATAEEKKLAQLYYIGSDENLDKWGKKLQEYGFASETVKVGNFNSAINNYEKAITELKKASEELTEAFLKSTNQFNKGSANEVKKRIEKNFKNIKANDAYRQLVKEGGLEKADALKKMREYGYTAEMFREGGLTAANAKVAGFSTGQIAKAYTPKEFKNAGYGAADAIKYYGRKTAIKTYGKSAVAKADAGKKKKTSIDVAKNGKVISNVKGTVSSTGKTVSVGKKSKLQYQTYDARKQKGVGKIKTVNFDDFTAKTVKKNQAEASKTLLQQLQTSKVGTKLHKNWTNLAKASSVLKSGKSVHNTASKIYGTLDGSGNFYYNTSKGINSWNPQTGKVTTVKAWKKDKATAQAFLTAAKKNKGVAREYYQLLDAKGIIKFGKKGAAATYTNEAYKLGLIKKKTVGKSTGIKKYAVGGLANYTGPAWLDGTPSKPELVLNATDTKNFVALRDVLSEATKRGAFSKDTDEEYNNMVLDIDIHVDEIANDYDVDQLVKRVKKDILQEAKSRNVTTVGRRR